MSLYSSATPRFKRVKRSTYVKPTLPDVGERLVSYHHERDERQAERQKRLFGARHLAASVRFLLLKPRYRLDVEAWHSLRIAMLRVRSY